MRQLVSKRTVNVAIALIVSLLMCSCGPSLDDRLNDLVAAKNQWIATVGDSPYSYDLGPSHNPAFTVTATVTNPGTLREDWFENPRCSAPGACNAKPTMRELYELVLKLTEEQYRSGGVLRVEYDPDMGYPTEIFWDNRKGSHPVIDLRISNVILIEESDALEAPDQ